MDENILCRILATVDFWHYVFAVLKYILLGTVIWFFYNYFIRKKLPKTRGRATPASIKLTLLKDKVFKPVFINLMIRNTGQRTAELNTPVLVFRRWARKRKFRILTVGSSITYPLLLEKGKAAVVNIELEQFYQYAPALRRARCLSVEMEELEGQTFKSPTIRIKW